MGVRVRQKDGSWWIFIHHKRKRWAKKIGGKKAAEETARHLSARLTLGLDARNGSDSPTLQEYATEWLRTYLPVYTKPRTAEFYEGMLRRHILPTLGSIRLSELSRRDVQALIAERAAIGLARNTLKGMVATLKVLCNHAIDQQVLTHNPAARLGRFTSGLTEKEARTIDAYTAEELSLLLETADQQYPDEADLITTMAWSGVRLGEAFGLQHSDVDYQAGVLEVRRTVDRRRRGVQVTSPKSNRQRRVAIPQALVNRLERRRDLAAARAAVDGHDAPLWVFPNRTNEPKERSAFIRKTWNPLLRAARVRSLPPHALRHTYASLLIQRGVSIAFVQKQLGHTSIQTTVDVYGHLVLAEWHLAIDDLFVPIKRNRRNQIDQESACKYLI